MIKVLQPEVLSPLLYSYCFWSAYPDVQPMNNLHSRLKQRFTTLALSSPLSFTLLCVLCLRRHVVDYFYTFSIGEHERVRKWVREREREREREMKQKGITRPIRVVSVVLLLCYLSVKMENRRVFVKTWKSEVFQSKWKKVSVSPKKYFWLCW